MLCPAPVPVGAHLAHEGRDSNSHLAGFGDRPPIRWLPHMFSSDYTVCGGCPTCRKAVNLTVCGGLLMEPNPLHWRGDGLPACRWTYLMEPPRAGIPDATWHRDSRLVAGRTKQTTPRGMPLSSHPLLQTACVSGPSMSVGRPTDRGLSSCCSARRVVIWGAPTSPARWDCCSAYRAATSPARSTTCPDSAPVATASCSLAASNCPYATSAEGAPELADARRPSAW